MQTLKLVTHNEWSQFVSETFTHVSTYSHDLYK